MEVINPFILKNKIGMVKFIDELCNVQLVEPSLIDEPIEEENNNAGDETNSTGCHGIDLESHDPAHDLAIIHSICENYSRELEQQAVSSAAAKKLLTISTILSKHKQYYANLKRNAHHNLNSTTTSV